MSKYLVESALLTHGLSSISNEELCKSWPKDCEEIIWMECGELIIGDMERFVKFRSLNVPLKRINYINFEECRENRSFGALTASGTMKACEEMGISLAITCGMGGLKTGQKIDACHDITALMKSPVSLIATSPKDMFDLKYTITSILNAGIPVYGNQAPVCNGYLFRTEDIALMGRFNDVLPNRSYLLLNGIPGSERIEDVKLLEMAVAYGKKEEEKGRYFHPAVNKKMDELSSGKSSMIQLRSMVENVKLAKNLSQEL